VKIHELKCWPCYFEAVWTGSKGFEIRKGDRGFLPGDVLHLNEWDQDTKKYTGRELTAKVSYVLQGGRMGIEEGYVVLSITRLQRSTSGRLGSV
jgi:hypothetical protein